MNEDDEDVATVISSKQDTIKAEMEEVELQIKKLGGIQSCGWDPADHKEFLRVKTRHNDRTNTVAFLRDVKGAVPTESEQSIKSHLDTFKRV